MKPKTPECQIIPCITSNLCYLYRTKKVTWATLVEKLRSVDPPFTEIKARNAS